MRPRIEKASFSGHETFSFRYSWLKKGIDGVLFDPEIFSKDSAMTLLGVGKNMVRSIRHWCLVARLIEEDPRAINNRGRYLRPTALGQLLFAEDGLDPYLEDPGTLWLLHWQVTTNPERATTWYWVFGCLHQQEFTKSQLMNELQSLVMERGWKRVSLSSLKRDVDCSIRTYVASRQAKAHMLEDTLDCPLVELGLIRELADHQTFQFQRGPQSSLPDAIFTFALIDFWDAHYAAKETLAFEEIAYRPGSPGRVFKLDEDSLAGRLDQLSDLTGGRLTYSETAGLKQVLRHGRVSAIDVLQSSYRSGLDRVLLPSGA